MTADTGESFYHGGEPCCAVPLQHSMIHAPYPPMDRTAGVLMRTARKRGRAYPRCGARELPPSRRHERTGEPYPWCGGRGVWTWNEQHLCEEHADQFRSGRSLAGVYPDGRWCRRFQKGTSNA